MKNLITLVLVWVMAINLVWAGTQPTVREEQKQLARAMQIEAKRKESMGQTLARLDRQINALYAEKVLQIGRLLKENDQQKLIKTFVAAAEVSLPDSNEKTEYIHALRFGKVDVRQILIEQLSWERHNEDKMDLFNDIRQAGSINAYIKNLQSEIQIGHSYKKSGRYVASHFWINVGMALATIVIYKGIIKIGGWKVVGIIFIARLGFRMAQNLLDYLLS